MKAVFSISSGAIKIWLYLVNPPMKDNIECPAVLSINISMCGRGKSTLSSFFRTGTTLASHSGYSTIDRKPILSCFWISSLTCKLHRGCNLLNFYLTSLTCARMGKWCWTIEGSRPGISSYDHANTSRFDLSRSINLLILSADKEVPIFSFLGWSRVPKCTNSVLPETGVTFLSSESQVPFSA